MLNLNLVHIHKNMIGQLIKFNYRFKPEETIQMIADQWKDDPLAVMKTIGIENVFALNLKLIITWNSKNLQMDSGLPK